MDKNEMLEKERLVVLQNFAEVYLNRKGLPPSSVMFKTIDEYGELTEEQVKLLHFYLMDEYQKMGLDLISAIKASGEEIVTGKLSKYEIQELIRRADDMIYFLGVLNMRKQAAQNNK